ncbi:pyroglutamyl-peptidase I [Zhihengliuella salsuginis]|uniref:Pyroglutamyl-peptidase I n=1 Tax=Zhihengliuella salsuginis TaxID=578222 RepID=A0ABQ3GHJ9_9MICC|nr:pyroglutamyl-peptidase I [Zhihengliuella salsuginis]GHD07187.1 pyrrolidone-carboxylate peptidase [Zhihengliuella salsuginis]
MILLTGFEPFGGADANPSIDAARLAAADLVRAGVDAAAVELPCVFGRRAGSAGAVLEDALAAHRPDVVIATGLAGNRNRLSLERVAINVMDARIADNAGEQPVDVPVRADGPAAYFTTLPVKRARARLEASGFPAEVSQTAGTYVCNSVFYELMHQLAGVPGARAGFVHVPPAAGQWSVPRIGRALGVVAGCAAGPDGGHDDVAPAGAES